MGDAEALLEPRDALQDPAQLRLAGAAGAARAGLSCHRRAPGLRICRSGVRFVAAFPKGAFLRGMSLRAPQLSLSRRGKEAYQDTRCSATPLTALDQKA